MIRPHSKLTVAPTAEPVTLDELQAHVLGYNSADNPELARHIRTARALFERHTGVSLVEQTWQTAFVAFPADGLIPLPKAPVRSITSVQYYDTTGSIQTVSASNYRYDDHGNIAVISPAINESWPASELGRTDAVIVTYVTGVYTVQGSPGDQVDESTDPATHFIDRYLLAQQAIKMLVTHLYENRGIVAPVALHDTPMGFQMIVDECRLEYF